VSTVIREKLNTDNNKYLNLLIVYYLNRVISGSEETSKLYKKSPFSAMAQGRKRIDQIYKDYIKTKDNYQYFPDDNGYNYGAAISFAVSKGHIEIVNYLIENGADVNIADKYGLTPVFFVFSGGNLQIAETLLKNGANASGVEQLMKTSALQSFFMFPPNQIQKEMEYVKNIVPLFIDAGADINNVDMFGDTVLSSICKKRLNELAEFLVSRGANPDIEVNGKKIKDICKENGIEINDEWLKKKEN